MRISDWSSDVCSSDLRILVERIAFLTVVISRTFAPLKGCMMTNVKIGTVQMSCVADKATNLNKAIDQIRIAAAKGAQLICLQELFTSLYFCDVEDYDNFELAEAITGPATEALQAVAR